MRLQIEKAVYGGAGLAHQTEGTDTGKAVFVPFTLPEEIVEAAPTGRKDGFIEAALVEVMKPSPDRIKAECEHFGTCGGCQYQHASYEAQIAIKVAILGETLSRAGIGVLPEIQVHSAQPWGYRNRTRLRMAEPENMLRVGYNKRGTNEFLAIRECPIVAPLLWRAAEALIQIGADDSNAGRWMREVVEVELFTNEDEKKLQVSVFVRKTRAGFSKFCERLLALMPELVGVGVFVVSEQRAQQHAKKPSPAESWGAEGLNYKVAEESYWVSRGGFFQVNRFLLDELVKIVATGRQGMLAWDLYAGVGLFSRALTCGFKQVVAVEVAGNDLTKSFKGSGKRAVEATAIEFLRDAVVQRERPELIVMDPPRAGMGMEVCDLLARVSAAEMVYVSCDPVTLARDLKVITKTGYRIVELHMVDLFPQTFHLETVVVLIK